MAFHANAKCTTSWARYDKKTRPKRAHETIIAAAGTEVHPDHKGFEGSLGHHIRTAVRRRLAEAVRIDLVEHQRAGTQLEEAEGHPSAVPSCAAVRIDRVDLETEQCPGQSELLLAAGVPLQLSANSPLPSSSPSTLFGFP